MANAQQKKAVTKIGPFILGRALGKGFAAQVREAIHDETGQRVAIKIMTKEAGEKAELLYKMREREIAIMKLVDHPHIVTLFDVYETSSHIYLVMELLEGTLFNYVVKNGTLSPRRALKFFQQIIDALEYMHRHLICHRDLKPENFLLGSHHTLKICDFGFASLMKGNDDVLNTRCGTLHYASPDILTEGNGYDGRLHDVWSAGVNLYVMVTGELPFNDNNPKVLLRKILSGSFRFPPNIDIPDELKDLICRMLTVDARSRITIPEIKNHPWYCSRPYTVPNDVVGSINPELPFEEIDEEVVKAVVLMGIGWDNGSDFEQQLKNKGTNAEKVVYLLVLRKKLQPTASTYSSTYNDRVRTHSVLDNGRESLGRQVRKSLPPGLVAPDHKMSQSPSQSPPQSPPPHTKRETKPKEDVVVPAESSSHTNTSTNKASATASAATSAAANSSKFGTGPRRGKAKNVPEVQQHKAVSAVDRIISWFQVRNGANSSRAEKEVKSPRKRKEEKKAANDEQNGAGSKRSGSSKKNIPARPELKSNRSSSLPSLKLETPETPKTQKKEGDAMIDMMNKLNETPKKVASPRASRKGIPFVPGSFYITFVPHNAEKQFEDVQKQKHLEIRKCNIQSRDASGNLSPIIDVEQLNTALANKVTLELQPST